MSVENTPYLRSANRYVALQPALAPTQEQLARRKRLRRFNRLVVYLPVGITALAWIVLILGLFWLTVAGGWFAMDTNAAYYRGLASGVADTFTIIMLAPLLLLCALPPVAVIALVVYRRRKSADPEDRPSLPLFWRIENIVVSVQDRTKTHLPKVASPVISAHATAAFLNRFLIELKQIISQEIDRNVHDR